MSNSVLPEGEDRDLEEYITRLLSSKQLDWHIEGELIDVVERLAPPVEGEEEFRKRLRARLHPAASGSQTIGSLIRQRITETIQRFPTRLNSPAALPQSTALLVAGAVILMVIGAALLLRAPSPQGTDIAQNPGAASSPSAKPTVPPFSVYLPAVSNPLVAPNPQSAVVADARGRVEVQASSGAWTAAQVGQIVAAGQRLRTGDLSSAALLFYDGSQAHLGPTTELSVDELDARVDGPRIVQLTQWIGQSDHDVTPSNDTASRYEVRTPSGTGIAKGTAFHVRVTADLVVRFNVDEGAVAVTYLNATVTVAAGQSTTVYAGSPPTQPVFRISGEGKVTQMGDVWRIGGRDFLVNTTPGEGRSVTEIVGNPKVGDWVSVEGRILPDGAYFADRIVLLRRAPENRFAFTGTVESIGVIEWTISGRAVRVNTDTDIDEGIESGDLVEATGIIVEDGTLLAQRIQRVDADGLPFEFVGIVEGIEDDNWTISGISIVVSDDTEIKGNPDVGDIVKVEGRILEDNTWLADEIKLAEEDERRFEFTGTVEAIDPWVVSDVHFDSSDATEIDDGIEVGDRVRVEGRVLDDGVWLAEEVQLLGDAEPQRFDFVGRVSRINPWIVGGLDIAVNDATRIDDDIDIGDKVRVRGVILPDGTLLARHIQLLDDDLGCVDIRVRIVGINGKRITLSDGQTIELTDDVEIEGELRVSAVVIIRICIRADGTMIVVRVRVIIRPLPPTPTPPPPPPPEGDDDDDDHGGGPAGGAFVITENNQTLTLTCNGHSVTINGNDNTITLLGRCSSVTIRGNSNWVSVQAAASITNTGNNNVIQQR